VRGLVSPDVEPWQVADIDSTIAAGFSVSGKQWGQPNNTWGLADIVNGISQEHQEFFDDGGLGFSCHIWKQIIESYYSFRVLALGARLHESSEDHKARALWGGPVLELNRSLLFLLPVFVILFGLTSQVAAATECPDTPLPVETGSDPKREANSLHDQALICQHENKHRVAIFLLSESLKRDPSNVITYLDRGASQLIMGDVELALSDYNAAISLQPQFALAWYDRGTTLAGLGIYDRAVADLSEAIRLRSDFAPAYCVRGVANFRTEHINEALLDFTAGIEHDPGLVECHINRGTLYLLEADYQKAIDDLTKALELAPSSAAALGRRGQAYEGLGQRDQALDDFRKALALNPNLISAKEGVMRLTAGQNH
jgi:tetratricopeptide (TPR) repeat protein